MVSRVTAEVEMKVGRSGPRTWRVGWILVGGLDLGVRCTMMIRDKIQSVCRLCHLLLTQTARQHAGSVAFFGPSVCFCKLSKPSSECTSLHRVEDRRSGFTRKCLARDRLEGTRKSHDTWFTSWRACSGCEIDNSHLEREEWFAVREVARHECGVVPLGFFDVSFQSRFFLHEIIKRSSSLDDCAAERSSWLSEAGWHALRTIAHCENAMLPIGLLPFHRIFMQN